jgi:ABC-2 type transport system ATP-binding protein
MAAIQVRGLRENYRTYRAGAGIDLTVAAGEVFALLGPNGAGKTTTIEILEGQRFPGQWRRPGVRHGSWNR